MNPLDIPGNSHKAWGAVREWVDACTDGECWECGKTPKKLHVHHRNGNGLDNREENLIGLCPSCHRKLHAAKIKADKAQR